MDFLEGAQKFVRNTMPGVSIIDDTFGTRIGGPNSSDRAIEAQRGAANQANQVLEGAYEKADNYLTDSYEQQQAAMNPYSSAGEYSLNQLQSGDFAQNLQMDPGYAFRMEEGRKALEGSAAARGMLNSGRTLKELARYGQDYASNEYQKAYDREYRRLSDLTGMGFNANTNLASAAGQYGANMANNRIGYGTQVSNNIIGVGNAEAASNIARGNQNAQLAQQGLQAILMASDRRLKTKIKPVSKADLDEMKKHLKAFAFQYKNAKHGEGDWVGVMAQDLEKSKLGRTLVVEDKDGNKMIDIGKTLSLFLATMAEA